MRNRKKNWLWSRCKSVFNRDCTESRKRPGTFVKGDPRINRTLGQYPKEKAEVSRKVQVPSLLRDMQRIWRTELLKIGRTLRSGCGRC